MVQKWKVIRHRGGAAPVLDAPYNPKMTDTGSLATALEQIVGAGHVLTDPDSRSSYETDWTRRYHGTARLVVRPGSTAEVSAVLSLCTEASAAVVPQGGNTGLVGGGVPRGGEVVLSLARLDLIEPVDTDAAQVTVGAGVTLARLQDHVRDAGFAFGVDLASRGSATIGGMIATNAGGIHVLHYGGMRTQLVGIEAVRADGAILRRLPGLTKDNTGYDLPGLIAGSEGTLAVITAARLKLVSQLPQRAVALLAVPDVASALDILARVRPLASLDAAELFFREGVELVCKHSGLPTPFGVDRACYVLLECAAQQDPLPELAAALEGAPFEDSAMAADRAGRDALWAYRERHTEAINAEGVPHKLDVALPLSRLQEFAEGVRPRLAHDVPEARRDPVRPRRRRQPARQRARPRCRRRPRDGFDPALRRIFGRQHQRRTWDWRREDALVTPHPQRRGDCHHGSGKSGV